MPYESRLRTVVRYRYCSRSLANNHPTHDCKSRKTYPACQGEHHILWHGDTVKSSKPTTGSRRTSLITTTISSRLAAEPKQEPARLALTLPIQHVMRCHPVWWCAYWHLLLAVRFALYWTHVVNRARFAPRWLTVCGCRCQW